MNKKILAVCDPEGEYAERLAEYLEQRQGNLFEVRTFFDVDKLISFCKEQADKIKLLLVSEAAYQGVLNELPDIHIMILNESGKVEHPEFWNVDKYQTAENIVREVMCYCTEHLAESIPRPLLKADTRIIGFYSPVRRCLQTSVALTMGQLLAHKNKVLYLNMEGYSGLSGRLPTGEGGELTELIYYAHNLSGKLLYRMESLIRKVGELDYVPPVLSAADLSMVSADEWKELFFQICGKCSYDYILLDLSDQMRGLKEVLKLCDMVYTLIEDAPIDGIKLREYETDLRTSGYGEVLDRTKKCRLPWLEQLPVEAELLPCTKLADYVQERIREDIHGGL